MFSSNKGDIIFFYFQAFLLSKVLLNDKFQRGMRLQFDIHIEKYGRILDCFRCFKQPSSIVIFAEQHVYYSSKCHGKGCQAPNIQNICPISKKP